MMLFVRRCGVCGAEIEVEWGPNTHSEGRRLLIEHIERSHGDREIRLWAMERLVGDVA